MGGEICGVVFAAVTFLGDGGLEKTHSLNEGQQLREPLNDTAKLRALRQFAMISID